MGPSLVLGDDSFGPKSRSSRCSPVHLERSTTSAGVASTCASSTLQRRLSQEVKTGLLRAVRLADVLRGWGKDLSSSSSTGSGYDLSVEVESIDTFFSHDWGTARWKKIVALLCYYNAWPIVLANLLACSIIIGLELGDRLGPALRLEWAVNIAGLRVTAKFPHHSFVVCPVVSVVMLFFWQRIRQVLPGLGPRYVFVDKMCIHQTDEDIKAEAILGLAAFLKNSRHLLILWSPRYLTRLWCVYEIASWVHLGNNFKSNVTIIPVSMAAAFLFGTIGLAAFNLTNAFIARLPFFTYVFAGISLLVPATTVPIYFLRRTVWELGHLSCQLKEFKVEKAECHCCTVGHGLGADASCDRELIYKALTEWFPDEDDCEGAVYLARFDDYVHEVVEPAVTQRLLGPSSRYMMCVLLLLPSLWLNTRVAGIIKPLAALGGGPPAILRVVLEPLLSVFLLFPSIAMTTLRLCSLSNRLGGQASLSFGLRCCGCISLVVLGTLLAALGLYGAMAFTRGLEDPAPFFCAIAFNTLFAVCMFLLPWRP